MIRLGQLEHGLKEEHFELKRDRLWFGDEMPRDSQSFGQKRRLNNQNQRL